MLEVRGFTHHCFSTARLNDCSTVVKLNLLSESQALLLHDGCAIHDTREGVPILVRQHEVLAMCDVFMIIGTRWVWTAVMPEADALAHIIRHKGRVYSPRDADSIPF